MRKRLALLWFSIVAFSIIFFPSPLTSTIAWAAEGVVTFGQRLPAPQDSWRAQPVNDFGPIQMVYREGHELVTILHLKNKTATDVCKLIFANKGSGQIHARIKGINKCLSISDHAVMLRAESGQAITDCIRLIREYDQWSDHLAQVPQLAANLTTVYAQIR
ncbi:MAG: hypothetical protein ACYC7E_09565 [Armatimonadota bacterium]